MFKKCFSGVAALLMIIVPELGITQNLTDPPATTRPTADADAQSLLSAFISYTDLRMNAVQQNLEILASTDEVKSAKWKRMKPLLSKYQKSDNALILWFARPDGTYYTVDKGRAEVKLSNRSYFPDLMSGQKIIGALVVRKGTDQRFAVIAVPLKKRGKVIGAIGASLYLDSVSDQVASALALRAGASFFSLAPYGLTTLYEKSDRHFLDPRELGSETLRDATNEMLSNSAGEITYKFDNVTKRAIFRTSPLTKWKFAIAFSDNQQKQSGRPASRQ